MSGGVTEPRVVREGGKVRGVLLAVSFHHVREANDARFPGLHFRTIADFKRQLACLRTRFEFPDPRDVLASMHGQGTIPGSSCLLTLDDGLRDHHDHVAPILDEMGIRAIFAVNTGPWDGGRMLSVHMVHLLSAAFSYEQLAPEFESSARRRGVGGTLADVPMEKAMVQYRFDTPAVARIKYFLNAVIPQQTRPAVVRDVFAARLGTEEEFAAMHYLTPGMTRALHEAGHTIALHSHWHTQLALEAAGARRDNLRMNAEFLREAIGHDYRPRWISYPYGSPSSYNRDVIAECEALGCEVGFTMRRGVNPWPAEVPMELMRVDTNEVEGGRNPVSWPDLWPKEDSSS